MNKGILPPPPPVYADVKVPHFYPHVEEQPLPPPIPVVEPHLGVNPYATYGPGYGYGFDPFVALGSNNNNRRVARKRVLRNRDPIFRQDVERKRRGTKVSVVRTRSSPLPSPTPTTVTLVSSPVGTKRQRRITQPQEFKQSQ